MRRQHRRYLHRARQPATAGRGRPSCRRPAFAHHPGGELSRFPGRHQWAGPGREHAEAGAELRRRIRGRGGRRRRFLQPALSPQHRRRVDRDAHRDRGFRRLRALAGPRIRAGSHWPWRQFLRHLRRILLSRQEDHGGGRRRFRHGGGQLPDALRPRGHAGPSPRRVPRLEDHARPRASAIPRSSSSPTRWWKRCTTLPGKS